MKTNNRGEGTLIPEARPLIEPGTYQMTAINDQLIDKGFGAKGKYGGRLIIDFEIVAIGCPSLGVVVQRFYTVTTRKKPNGKLGFQVGTRSDLYRELRACFPWRKDTRRDRLSFADYYKNTLLGEVTTVTTDSKKRELYPEDRYSKVKRIIQTVELS